MDWVTTEPRSMMDIVYEVLKQAIIKGELEPGERIVEKKIADML
ncbi:MAG: GntR family transcriptional regulator, partial [Firmicutes bacterium]|nr:GntR family transcriptional regulator [Bacillota bacterium]